MRMLLNVWLVVLVTLMVTANSELILEDATATVNQLFIYKINPEDFPEQSVKVTETGKNSLPSWLEFNTNELIGVPTAKDKGTYILSAGKEVFAITVQDATVNQVAQPTNSNDKTICKPHDAITVVYIKLNEDTDALPASQRSDLIHSISSHLSLKPNHISLSSRPNDLVDTSSALVSGTGDTPPSNDVSVLSWIVGCGAVRSHHMDILEQIESSTKDGSMAKRLKTAVSGWQVQSNQQKAVSKRRLKRQALVTATPSPSSSSVGDETTTSSSVTDGVEPTVTTVTASQTIPEPQVTVPVEPPLVNSDLLPASISANGGEIFRWVFPNGLFIDPKGRVLTYSIQSDSNERPWLQVTSNLNSEWQFIGVADQSLNGETETIMLTATNSEGGSVTVEIPIQHGYHKMYMTEIYSVKIMKSPWLKRRANVVYLAETLQELTGLENILIEELDKNYNQDEILVRFGDNRGRQTECPSNENEAVLNKLRELVNMEKSVVGLNGEVMKITAVVDLEHVSPCSDRTPVVNTEKIMKYRPLTVNLGELHEETIPIDLFTDYEDVDLRTMRIKLLVDNLVESDGWVSVDSKTRKLQALTWDTPNSQSQFTLIAIDTAGNEVEAEIEVRVVEPAESISTNLFTLTIDEQYSDFANSHDKQVELSKKLKQAFSGSIVTIKSVKSGSVVVQYELRNDETSSVPPDQCPEEAIASYKKTVFSGEDVNSAFVKKLSPYKVNKVEFAPMGPCEGMVKPKSATVKEPPAEDPEEPKELPTTVIIIVVVILAVVIIITIVVIVCVRRCRKREAPSNGQNGSYIEKGVPVVLDEEMRSINKSENQPLMTSAEVSYKPTPPAYPGEERDDYQPDTPPVSEPDDERRIISDRSP